MGKEKGKSKGPLTETITEKKGSAGGIKNTINEEEIARKESFGVERESPKETRRLKEKMRRSRGEDHGTPNGPFLLGRLGRKVFVSGREPISAMWIKQFLLHLLVEMPPRLLGS